MARYEVRREDSGRWLRRRRYVVMEIDHDGYLEWESEPLRRSVAAQRLVKAGEHTTDAWDLVAAADLRAGSSSR